MTTKRLDDRNGTTRHGHFAFETPKAGRTKTGVPYLATYASVPLQNGRPFRRITFAFGRDDVDLVLKAIADGGATLSYEIRLMSAVVITGPAPLARAA